MKIDVSISYTAGDHWFRIDNHEKYGFKLNERRNVYESRQSFFGDDMIYDAERWLKSMFCDVRILDPEEYVESQLIFNKFHYAIRNLRECRMRIPFYNVHSLFWDGNKSTPNIWFVITAV